MKVSICIPQYNRIELLLKNLDILAQQTYPDIEVVISDDCSQDDTHQEILLRKNTYRYPVVYHRFETNQGYDRNFRKSIELATGTYAFVLGNDDTLLKETTIDDFVKTVSSFSYPDLGYVNYVEDRDAHTVIRRATETTLYEGGVNTAIKHANGFSYVAGVFFKKSVFHQYNTSAQDGSIYAQMYLALLMIARGCRLLTISDAMVRKDITVGETEYKRKEYKDVLPKSWKEYRRFESGLLNVAKVLLAACRDAQVRQVPYAYRILKRLYTVNYPYWFEQYKHFGSMAASWSLAVEMNSFKSPFRKELTTSQRWRINTMYVMATVGAMIIPYAAFNNLQHRLRKMIKS